MNKVYIKKLLSLAMVLLLVFPVLGLASSPPDIAIKSVYFQDNNGNMVFIDYEEAIRQSLAGDHTLYNGIKHYVGIAEKKGKPIYIETNTGKVLDYRLAMLDNLFRLEDILGKGKYEVNKEIKCTHELKVVNGVAVIVEIKKDVHSNYTIDIRGPRELEVGNTGNYNVRAYGDNTGNTSYRARYEYIITGGTGTLEYRDGNNWIRLPLSGCFGASNGFTLTPDWDVTTELRFTPAEQGTYYMEMSLIDLDGNKIISDAEYRFIVRTIEEPVNIVRITPVNGITVDLGTSLSEAIGLLPHTTTIIDSKEISRTVSLAWTIENYNGDVEGAYKATGTFNLPEGINNGLGMELKVEAMVTVAGPVIPDWPIEVEGAFVGMSQITGNTYTNIEIKEEYISNIKAVYVDGNLANNMGEQPSQWRIEVEEGTTVESLKRRISVTLKEVEIPKDFDVKIDKGQYNIDEEIKLTGLASRERLGLENVDITLKVVGEEGLILVEQLITGDGGRFSYTFNMPSDSIAGRYTIIIKGQEPINETVEINFMLDK